jgi:hypothetical protein
MRVADARDRQWDILRDAGGLPVGGWCRATCRRGGRSPLVRRLAVMADRERAGRDASPSAAIIDSQSVDHRGLRPARLRCGQKVNGRKRHALVDTDGRGLVIEPHPASVQDRDGNGPLLSERDRGKAHRSRDQPTLPNKPRFPKMPSYDKC